VLADLLPLKNPRRQEHNLASRITKPRNRAKERTPCLCHHTLRSLSSGGDDPATFCTTTPHHGIRGQTGNGIRGQTWCKKLRATRTVQRGGGRSRPPSVDTSVRLAGEVLFETSHESGLCTLGFGTSRYPKCPAQPLFQSTAPVRFASNPIIMNRSAAPTLMG